mmetsp:Transcript_60603/g.169334  ORF Transcript_60603/g.169334 Transcript_60603/m.169334 type:complete len:259 (+) Transcript_60603:340-1116(+)
MAAHPRRSCDRGAVPSRRCQLRGNRGQFSQVDSLHLYRRHVPLSGAAPVGDADRRRRGELAGRARSDRDILRRHRGVQWLRARHESHQHGGERILANKFPAPDVHTLGDAIGLARVSADGAGPGPCGRASAATGDGAAVRPFRRVRKGFAGGTGAGCTCKNACGQSFADRHRGRGRGSRAARAGCRQRRSCGRPSREGSSCGAGHPCQPDAPGVATDGVTRWPRPDTLPRVRRPHRLAPRRRESRQRAAVDAARPSDS